MNIITIIQTALTALNSDAELFLLDKPRAENEELNHTGDVIVVYPDWKTTNELNQGMELLKTRVYNIDFKTLDEWDNSDNQTSTAYDSSTSVDRIEDMESLADSVFSYVTAYNNLFPKIKEKLKWRAPEPILRANNGTMSGVSIQLTVSFAGDRVCDYDPSGFTVSYRNAVIPEVASGTIATLNFEAKIDTDSDVTFTVNWGVNVGTTIIKKSFTTDVWESLQTQMLIPLAADVNQQIRVADNFGGGFNLNYTVRSTLQKIKDGNSPGWYLTDELSTITKDASDFMSEWRDFLGSGHDLLQALGSSQPKWFINDGVKFDGIDDSMKTLPFTFNQPEQIYIVFKQITYISQSRIFDGNISNDGILRQILPAGTVNMYAGTPGPSSLDLALDTFGVVLMLFDGVNSKLIVNDNAPVAADAGISDSNGFTIGAGSTGTVNFSNVQFKEIILRKVADSTQDKQDIKDYLKTKYSL